MMLKMLSGLIARTIGRGKPRDVAVRRRRVKVVINPGEVVYILDAETQEVTVEVVCIEMDGQDNMLPPTARWDRELIEKFQETLDGVRAEEKKVATSAARRPQADHGEDDDGNDDLDYTDDILKDIVGPPHE